MPGLYLSYPFCSQKCTFCNFASGVHPPALQEQYARALRAEVSALSWPWLPETIYLGGGTPSSMNLTDLRQLLALIPGRPWREATLEAAPGTITPEKAQAWQAAGIDRVSLGVQSFDSRELARTGRRHSAQTVREDIATLRAAGIGKLNIDLIAGLPGQTRDTWRNSLEAAVALHPGHISVYIFEIDEDSRLGQEVLFNGQRYGAPDVPSEELTAELYETAVSFLAAAGLPRYEISNFAAPGHASLHNLKYWQREPYLGCGADAHSFDGAQRWQNAGTLEEYVARWQRGESPAVERTPASEDEERFFVGLRLSAGITPRAAEWQQHAAPIQRFLDTGHLATDGTRLWLTDAGVLLSNEVLQEFIHA